MNKNVKIITLITAVALSLAYVGSVQAQERGNRDRNNQEVVVNQNQGAVNYERRARDSYQNDRRDRDNYNNDRRGRDNYRNDRRGRNVVVIPQRGRHFAKNRHISKKQLKRKIRKMRRIRRWNARYDNRPMIIITPDRFRFSY